MQMAYNHVFASGGPLLPYIKADGCTAPAPGSFRITSIGGNFIALAWTPVWVEAAHTLAVLENDGAGGWIALDTIHNVLGSAYTVDGLASGTEYRFIIATNCTSGEPSSLKAIIDGIALILDLAIIGRNPSKPVPVDCSSIPLDQNWVGFKVEYINSGISIVNLFEFVITGGNSASNNFFWKAEIRRVFRDHPIVAVDPDDIWPTCTDPIIENVGTSFRMARLFGGGPNMELIGWVDFYQNSGSNVSICPDYDHKTLPWKKACKFTALVATKASSMPGCGNRSDNHTTAYAEFKAQSPFDQTLQIFFPSSFSGDAQTNIRLVDSQGQVILEHKINLTTSEIAFPVRSVLPGVYILYIENGGERHTLKIFKV